MLTRLFASLAVVIATTFGGAQTARAAAEDGPTPRVARTAAAPPDVAAVVLDFGDLLTDLYDALSFDAGSRDRTRVDRACDAVVDAHPQLVDALDETGVELLVAAHSLVDACRQGFAMTLPLDAFEIVDGDFYEYRELSLTFVP